MRGVRTFGNRERPSDAALADIGVETGGPMFKPSSSQAGWSGLVGGLLWALTPLRQPVFGAGRTAAEGETFFRVYNLVLILIAVLLTIALLRLREALPPSRVTSSGWGLMLIGHILLMLGSLPALLLGDAAAALVTAGQDLGFVGAMVAALGALLLGAGTLGVAQVPTTASILFLLTLPLGLVATTLLSVVGTPEDYLGLPLTILYGSAFIILGLIWTRRRGVPASPRTAAVTGD